MLILVLTLLAQVLCIEGMCYPDSSYCDSCPMNLFFLDPTSNICLGVCPTRYLLSDGTCIEASPFTPLLFDADFSIPIDLSSSKLGNFISSTRSFQLPNGPVQTKDRGLYLPQYSSLMLDSNPIPSPSFSIVMWVRVINGGTIFEIKGVNEYLRFEVDTGEGISYRLILRVCMLDNYCDFRATYIEEIGGGRGLIMRIGEVIWRYFAISINAAYSTGIYVQWLMGGLTFSDAFDGTNTVGLYEKEKFVWTIGSSDAGYEGFMYRIRAYNTNIYEDLPEVTLEACDPFYFYYDGQCLPCSDQCDISPLWCVRDVDCSICYSNQCVSCKGYSADLCNDSVVCSSFCIECSNSQTCTKCDVGYMILQDNSGTYCSDHFEIYLLSNVFPETLMSDNYPILNPSRGAYFDGSSGMYLETKVPMVIPSDFIIYMWINPIAGTLLSKDWIFALYDNFYISIEFTDGYYTDYFQTGYENSGWQYFAFQTDYSYYNTICTSNKDDYYVTYNYYQFVDSTDYQFLIGTDPESRYFQGFIAVIGILSIRINENYNLDQRLDLNFYSGALNPCEMVDTSNCEGNCEICDVCYDYNDASCFDCEWGSYYDGTYCGDTCAGVVYFGNCYDVRGICLLSALGLACESCYSPFVLYENICISLCPSSTNLVDQECVSHTNTQIFSINFADMVVISSINYFEFGKDHISEYPNFDKNDPVPIPNRGYYFSESSYITSSAYSFGPNLSIALWIRFQSDIEISEIFSKQYNGESLISFYRDINNYLPLITVVGSKILEDTNDVNMLCWQYIQIQISYDKLYLASTISIIYNTVVSSTNLLENDFWSDQPNSVLIIGSKESIGFIGILYSIEVYSSGEILTNMFSTDCTNSDYCPSNSPSLSLCDFLQIDPDCTQCHPDCIDGCIRPGDCGLCSETTCQQCNDINEICDICITGFYLVQGFCLYCPTGFTVIDGVCEVTSNLAFSVVFNQLPGVIYDLYNSIPIITGSSEDFYPNYEFDDPIATYKQGYYFNGKTSVIRLPVFGGFIGPQLVLAPSWTLEMWLMPTALNGCLATSTSTDSTLFSICYTETSFSIKIQLTNSFINDIGIGIVPIENTWQVIRIIIEKSEFYYMHAYLNNILRNSILLNGSIFPNYWKKITYAFGSDTISYYKGFIYQISFFTSAVVPTRSLLETTCSMPFNGECLPECPISQYWVGPNYNNCTECLSDCPSCRWDFTCSLCENPLCQSCSSFETDSCIVCADNTVDQIVCACASGYSYNYTSYSCQLCPELCTSCVLSRCLACIENAKVENDLCKCFAGFNGTDCTPAYFTADLIVNSDNTILVNFADPLLDDLQSNDLKIKDSDKNYIEFSLSKWSDSRYFIKPTIKSTIPSNYWVNVTFLHQKKTLSIYNSILSNLSLIGDLYPSYITQSDINTTLAAENVGTVVAVAFTASSISVALVNPNPACLWSFINTIQMICFILMSSIEIPPKFKGYLKGLRKYNFFPNIFLYFVPDYGGEKPFIKAYDFGYHNDLILFNSGNYISAFISMLVIWLIFYILSKFTHLKPLSIPFLKKKIETSLQGYKYNAFIRFWITCYLDVFAAALIVFITTRLSAWTSIVNLVVAIGITVRFI